MLIHPTGFFGRLHFGPYGVLCPQIFTHLTTPKIAFPVGLGGTERPQVGLCPIFLVCIWVGALATLLFMRLLKAARKVLEEQSSMYTPLLSALSSIIGNLTVRFDIETYDFRILDHCNCTSVSHRFEIQRVIVRKSRNFHSTIRFVVFTQYHGNV